MYAYTYPIYNRLAAGCLAILLFIHGSTATRSNRENMTQIRIIDKSEKKLYEYNATGKVLLYFTSILMPDRLEHFKHLWPLALRKSDMLRNADILIHAGVYKSKNNQVYGSEPRMAKKLVNVSATPLHLYNTLLRSISVFPNQYIRIRYFDNPGYQQGAVKSMIDGLHEDWFTGYDWVIRLNPDVMIFDDTRLVSAMSNSSYHLIGSTCKAGLMTDFVAFRPSQVEYKRWNQEWNVEKIMAEVWSSTAFRNILNSNKVFWLQNTPNISSCRIIQFDILHDHKSRWEEQLYRFFYPEHKISASKCVSSIKNDHMSTWCGPQSLLPSSKP